MLTGIFSFFPGIADIHPQMNSKAQSATRSESREGLTATLLQLLYREAIPAAPHPLTIKKGWRWGEEIVLWRKLNSLRSRVEFTKC